MLADRPGMPADRQVVIAYRLGVMADQLGVMADGPGLMADWLGMLAERQVVIAYRLGVMADGPGLIADWLGMLADRQVVIAYRPRVIAYRQGTITDRQAMIANRRDGVDQMARGHACARSSCDRGQPGRMVDRRVGAGSVQRGARRAADCNCGRQRGGPPAWSVALRRLQRFRDVLEGLQAAIGCRQGDCQAAEGVQLEQGLRVFDDRERDAEEHSPAEEPAGPRIRRAVNPSVGPYGRRAVDRQRGAFGQTEACVERRLQEDQRRVPIERREVESL